MRRVPLGTTHAATLSFSPACCAIRLRARGTICAFRASGCSSRSACAARCSSRIPPGPSSHRPSCTPRRGNWARLGLLYLDGVWQGERLLPEGWVAYTLTPPTAAPDAGYGAHMWLKIPDARDLGEPPMLEESYYMLGYNQQVVAVIPSRDLVLVRLGLSHDKGSSELAQNLAAIVDAFPTKRSESPGR